MQNHLQNAHPDVQNNKFVFEVGGSGKGTKQIAGLKNAFILKDNLEYPVGNAIPLWMIGLLY